MAIGRGRVVGKVAGQGEYNHWKVKLDSSGGTTATRQGLGNARFRSPKSMGNILNRDVKVHLTKKTVLEVI